MNLTRRKFLGCTLAAGVLGGRSTEGRAAPPPRCTVRALTRGPRHHFFGCRGRHPWNWFQSHLLCLETTFQDHLPTPEEAAAIGVVDARTGQFNPVAQTRAWNFQHGPMLHWNPLVANGEIIFNDRQDGELVTVVLNYLNGKRRTLPRPVSLVNPAGKMALTLNFGRLGRLQPSTSYPGLRDPHADDPHPENDGLFKLDVQTGQAELLVSIAAVFRLLEKDRPDLKDRHLWLGHPVFDQMGSQFLFPACAWAAGPERQVESALFTQTIDGQNLTQVLPMQPGLGHYTFHGHTQVLAVLPSEGREPTLIKFTPGNTTRQVLGEGVLTGDLQCSLSPNHKWLAADPVDGKTGGRSLVLLDMASQDHVQVASFPLGAYLHGDLRCALNPRWDRHSSTVWFDALDARTGTRQLHLAELDVHVPFKALQR